MINRRSVMFPGLAALTFLLGNMVATLPISAGGALKVGDPAPEFTLPGSDGKQYSLSDFRDKAFVVIAFFPKAFTGG